MHCVAFIENGLFRKFTIHLLTTTVFFAVSDGTQGTFIQNRFQDIGPYNDSNRPSQASGHWAVIRVGTTRRCLNLTKLM